MDVGFTGTQEDMTPAQWITFADVVTELRPSTFRHGDCIGSDARAHRIVRGVFPECRIVIHPPSIASKRAFCEGDEERTPKAYLDRNTDIVVESSVLIATPRENAEKQRSGTWSTIRKARRARKRLIVIHPDGRFTEWVNGSVI